MTTTTALATIAAALVSILSTSVIVRPTWSASRKRTVALILAGILGLVSAAVTGQLGLPDPAVVIGTRVVVMVAVVIVAAQGFHRQLAGALGVLEKATSSAPVEGPTLSEADEGPTLANAADSLDTDLTPDSTYTPEHAETDDATVVPDGEGVATNQA